MSSLRVRYDPDPNDDIGQLWLSLNTDRFAGAGYFWSYREGVRELADKLRDYPLSDTVIVTWGFDDAKASNEILSVRIEQVNRKGDLVATVRIADLYDLDQRLTASFSTTYSELETFRVQLIALAEGQANEAMLTGS